MSTEANIEPSTAQVYSGDPNHSRDKSKDFVVVLDGVEIATILMDAQPPQVIWRVYGPQDASRAILVGEAIAAAALLAVDGVAQKSQTTTEAPKKARNYTVAIREEIAAGKTDDEIWELLRVELSLTNDKRYRVKEVRKEQERVPLFA